MSTKRQIFNKSCKVKRIYLWLILFNSFTILKREVVSENVYCTCVFVPDAGGTNSRVRCCRVNLRYCIQIYNRPVPCNSQICQPCTVNCPTSSVWVFIAQLVEHCSANAEATGSNPVEAPKNFFSGYFRNCLNWDSLQC